MTFIKVFYLNEGDFVVLIGFFHLDRRILVWSLCKSMENLMSRHLLFWISLDKHWNGFTYDLKNLTCKLSLKTIGAIVQFTLFFVWMSAHVIYCSFFFNDIVWDLVYTSVFQTKFKFNRLFGNSTKIYKSLKNPSVIVDKTYNKGNEIVSIMEKLKMFA